MQDIELRLITNNAPAVKGIREVAAESDKLYKNNEKQQKRQIGLIADIENELKRLQEAQKNAMTVQHIERYNKKIVEAKQALQEYNEAGVKVEKQGNSLMQSVGKWALGFVSVATALKVVKDAFAATEQGLRTFNVVGAVTKQIMYDLVDAGKISLANILLSIKANKEAERVRVKQRDDIVEISKAQRVYNELYFAASDMTKSSAERLMILNQSEIAHGLIIDKKIEQAREELGVLEQMISARPKETKLLDAHSAKLAEIENLEGERFSETKRLERQRTGLIQEEIDNRLQSEKDYLSAVMKLNEIAEKFDADRRKERESAGKQEMSRLEKEYNDKLEFEIEYGKKLYTSEHATAKKIFDDRIENDKKQKEADEKVAKAKIDNLESIGEAVLKYIDIIDELAQREVDNAQRKRELFETQISEIQSDINSEIELRKSGFAANVEAKQIELAALKKQRDKALKDEEAARKREHALRVAALVAQKAIDIAKVISSTAVAKAEAYALMGNPVTLAAGIALLASAKVSQAINIAAITAAVIAASMSKYAKGGWTGDGKFRDSTGERMAGIVHEREFVIRKGPASKFRGVLEAINKDDRKAILMSFNKINPELLKGQNNILIENNGPNTRLDRLITISEKQANSESIQVIGNRTIYKKGNTTRIIKR